VVDSSRYYVLRIVDRVSGRHAFIGMGFRCGVMQHSEPSLIYKPPHALICCLVDRSSSMRVHPGQPEALPRHLHVTSF